MLRGPADRTILALAEAADAGRVLWTRRYEAAAVALDARVISALRQRGVEGASFNGRLIREPWELSSANGAPAATFSAFWRRHRAFGANALPLPAPAALKQARWPERAPERIPIEALRLTPTAPDWSTELALDATPGEDGGLAALARFVDEAFPSYASRRDQLASDATSRLSAHLRFGELSVRRVAFAVERAPEADRRLTQAGEKYLAELGWRDYAAAILLAHPDMAERPLRREYERFPWRDDRAHFRAWTRGETGYPVVDAGMRQLWRTGFLPNRVRMIAASFLAKHLLIDWRRGEQWFWDTLCDADPANNPQNWQWVAGCGVDAAPYFRIFNPVLQSDKFDPDGAYVRRWVPELERLPAPDVHAPWRASEEALARAGIVLGRTYPKPIVDHGPARARALAAFAQIKGEG